jgi:hypothetical protein
LVIFLITTVNIHIKLSISYHKHKRNTEKPGDINTRLRVTRTKISAEEMSFTGRVVDCLHGELWEAILVSSGTLRP